ncbi:VPLPA-CTERM-specific exosortase XrtD [uncultured Nitrospira sp.]|uniref:VPLPA-CTERM-specific exosortase XrtD n=1 Tax=uncultured Nitrospira sp. TaxID=157176 RepID=UPI003140AECF
MAQSISRNPPQGSDQSFQIAWSLVGILAAALVVFVVFYDNLAFLWRTWLGDENYGHGLLVPPIALYLAWEDRKRLSDCDGGGAWVGLVIIAAGMGLFIMGHLGTLFVVQHLALWLVIVGLVLAAWGVRGGKILAFPLGLLLMTIPLPQFLFQGLSAQLRSISSTLGVTCLQVVGITAFQDGNVIDLGPIQLQVVEACSGLRFLFPLMTLALLCAYFLQDRLWKRIFVFLSSIPIAILLNGFRIGMIGILVEWWGKGAADGFIHLFEGWVIFLVGVALLVGEMVVLKGIRPQSRLPGACIQSPEQSEGEVASEESAHQSPGEGRARHGFHRARMPWAVVVGLVVVGAFGMWATQLDAREERLVSRQSFADFPLQLGPWEGRARPLEQVYLDALRFDDYLLADFHQKPEGSLPVNLYVAFYQSQRSGESIHSPQSCIPGDGWLIESVNTISLEPPTPGLAPIFINEVTITKGEARQLVWYWFRQRQRNLTNEYLVKWYLVWDAVTQQRTDGALIRLTTPIPAHGDVSIEKSRLAAFANLVYSNLEPYVPR